VSWIFLIAYIFIALNTGKYSLEVWREKNKTAGIFILLLALSLILLPSFILLR
jgi:arginine exporter protein ArgO